LDNLGTSGSSSSTSGSGSLGLLGNWLKFSKSLSLMSSVKNKVGSDGGNTTDTEEGTTTRGIDVTKEKYLVNEKNQINK